jgi:hypothetical protein
MNLRRQLRSMVVPSAAIVCLAAVAGCGSSSPKTTSTTQAPTSSTASTATAATVTVTPPQGPTGTAFKVAAAGFKPGESLRFEFSSAQGKPYTGPPHKVAADGTVSATYNPASGQQPGVWTVKATGDQGTTAQGQFTVTSGATKSSTTTTTKP